MSKHSKINGKSGKREIVISKRVELQAEMIEEGVKESRVDNSYSRKQMGKARDMARREQRSEQSRNNRRKSNRNNR